ncbi:MAG TPA: flagellar basal body rod C-terminal domain-containing protein [Devosia sp.]
MSALSIAAAGMNAAATRFERNAANITAAGAGTPAGQGVDMATEMVDMLMNQTTFEVLANVARRASDMQKHAIDILA